METWYRYRDAWARRPWVAAIGVLAALLVVVGVVSTVLGGQLALLFIPGLGGLYVHHLLVQRVLDRS